MRAEQFPVDPQQGRMILKTFSISDANDFGRDRMTFAAIAEGLLRADCKTVLFVTTIGAVSNPHLASKAPASAIRPSPTYIG